MKRALYVGLFVLLALSVQGCTKAFTTSITLAVDYDSAQGLVIPKPKEGICYIHISSNGEWQAALSSEEPWCSIDTQSGSGNAYIRLTYETNTLPQPRTAVFTVSGQGRECSFPITQVKAETE